ncbi:hypothetical protein H9P43_007955 [Blastocladiella emersonii ATCC 22665]|nr:hypothetical protein H9P43_007951 [Blastocladiella emersonii ATCC 22665]KAI9168582.1 hypothetical protein H9P43_007955 [Blastocladiella emersonii ATCC 22665]
MVFLAHVTLPAHALVTTPAVVYFPSLKRVYIFGGENTPGGEPLATVVSYNLSKPFSIDKPPVTSLPALPVAAARLIPLVYSGAKDGEYFVELTSGWSRPPGVASAPNQAVVQYSVPANTVRLLDAKTDTDYTGCARSAAALPVQEWFGPTMPPSESDNAMYCFGGLLGVNGPGLTTLRILGANGKLRVPTDSNGGPSARNGGAMVRLNATTAMLTGGWSGGAEAWLFDIATSTWSRYPHSLNISRARHQIIVYTFPDQKRRYAINVGDGTPFIEYFELTSSGPATVGKIINAGQGPLSIRSFASVLAGSQILFFGGVAEPSDQLDLHVLTIVPNDTGLEFQWSPTFTPPTPAEHAQAYGFAATANYGQFFQYLQQIQATDGTVGEPAGDELYLPGFRPIVSANVVSDNDSGHASEIGEEETSAGDRLQRREQKQSSFK